MAGFVTYELTTDEAELAQQAMDALAAQFPGWVANEAHLEVALITELARMVAESAEVAADVPTAIFREYGRKVIQLDPVDGAPAGHLATWTMVDNAGYTVPAGTVYAYRTPTGEYQLWQTLEEAVVVAGQVAVAGVPGQAVEDGTDANGIADATAFDLVDGLAYVDSVVSDTASSGGVAPETDDEYLDRLADELALSSPRPILPGDFAVLARRVEGVHRALAIDGYDPAVPSDDNERMVALAAVDELGNAVSVGVRGNMQAYLDAQREINFVVNVFDPTYTDVAVDFDATALPGYDPAEVLAAAIQAVTDYLDPARWSGGADDPPVWRLDDTVRLYEVATVINNVAGVDLVTALTLNGVAANLALAGRAPLPSRVEAAGSTVVGAVV